MSNNTTTKVINFRVTPEERALLDNLSTVTGINKSDWLRFALNEVLQELLYERELPEPLRLQLQLKQNLEALKELRWTAYTKDDILGWLRQIERARPIRTKGTEPEQLDRKYRILYTMTDAMFDTYEQMQHERLALITEYETKYEKREIDVRKLDR